MARMHQELWPRPGPPPGPGSLPHLVSPQTWGGGGGALGQNILQSLWENSWTLIHFVKIILPCPEFGSQWARPEPGLHAGADRHLPPLLLTQPRHLGALHPGQLRLPPRQGIVLNISCGLIALHSGLINGQSLAASDHQIFRLCSEHPGLRPPRPRAPAHPRLPPGHQARHWEGRGISFPKSCW